MQETIVFVHGMFMNPVSWENWERYFSERGYRCLTPAWPLHEGDPEALRMDIPAGTGDLELAEVIAAVEQVISGLEAPPIVIGHSVGGLVAQVLVNRGKAAAGVCISPVAPNAMLSFEWHFLKSTVPILNPIKGDAPFEMTLEGFRETFANTLSPEESRIAWETYAVHESRNVLRTSLGEAGHVDFERPHAPLLFVSGLEDHIVPDSLVEKNFEAYAEESGIKDIRIFEGRDHFICGDPGWEEVADFIYEWLQDHDVVQHVTSSAAI